MVRSAIRHVCPGMDKRLGIVLCHRVPVERVVAGLVGSEAERKGSSRLSVGRGQEQPVVGSIVGPLG